MSSRIILQLPPQIPVPYVFKSTWDGSESIITVSKSGSVLLERTLQETSSSTGRMLAWNDTRSSSDDLLSFYTTYFQNPFGDNNDERIDFPAPTLWYNNYEEFEGSEFPVLSDIDFDLGELGAMSLSYRPETFTFYSYNVNQASFALTATSSSAVPEPSTLWLIVSGGTLLWLWLRRRRAANSVLTESSIGSNGKVRTALKRDSLENR